VPLFRSAEPQQELDPLYGPQDQANGIEEGEQRNCSSGKDAEFPVGHDPQPEFGRMISLEEFRHTMSHTLNARRADGNFQIVLLASQDEEGFVFRASRLVSARSSFRSSAANESIVDTDDLIDGLDSIGDDEKEARTGPGSDVIGVPDEVDPGDWRDGCDECGESDAEQQSDGLRSDGASPG